MASQTFNWEDRIGRRLKLRDLHILSTVVHWGSMAKGATHLGMSQPAVSEAIANLESVLGVRLLDRTSRGIEPTVYARALLKREHVVFDELKEGIRDIEYLSNPTVGEVRIGCPEAMTAAFVPAIVQRFWREYPRIVVHLVNAQTAEQEFRELRERSVDLMVGRVLKPLADDDITMEVLCEDEFFVVAGSRNKWVRCPTITLEELRDEPWVLFPTNSLIASYVAEALRANGLEPPRESVTSFSLHARMQLLANGHFLTVMFGSVLRGNAKPWSLRVLPIDLGIPPVPIAIFTLKNRILSPIAELFIKHARAVSKALTSNR